MRFAKVKCHVNNLWNCPNSINVWLILTLFQVSHYGKRCVSFKQRNHRKLAAARYHSRIEGHLVQKELTSLRLCVRRNCAAGDLETNRKWRSILACYRLPGESGNRTNSDGLAGDMILCRLEHEWCSTRYHAGWIAGRFGDSARMDILALCGMSVK